LLLVIFLPRVPAVSKDISDVTDSGIGKDTSNWESANEKKYKLMEW
jgi:hypothetical protein